jgi:TrkA domain protein
MADVRETTLPGVGVRHDFVTADGSDVSVLVHHDGRREIMVWEGDDPDVCHTVLSLSPADATTMNELLGGSRITEAIGVVQHEVEGLVIDWITVVEGSQAVGTSLADGAYRARTGASIVAIVRGEQPIPAPGPDVVFEAADIAVAVGTIEGLTSLRRLLGEPA